MKKDFLAIFFFLLLISPPALARVEVPNPIARFQKANEVYRAGHYAEAASLYESLIKEGWKNPTVFYNLGNAYFKQERLGPAILQYEKAKRLEPRDRDISDNLEYVKGLLEYRIEDKRNWYLKMGEVLLTAFTQEELGIVSLTVGALFWISWALLLYFRPESVWGWKRKTLLVIAGVGLSLWILKGIHAATVREAIVLKNQAAVRYGPSYKDRVAFRLGEGLKVGVKKQAGEWGQVVLTNGETGWMSQEEMGVI